MNAPSDLEQQKKISSGKFFLISLVIAVVLFVLDQLTKELVVQMMTLHERIVVINGFFNITSVRNNGAAWNMLAGKKWFLLLISFTAMAGIIFFFRNVNGIFDLGVKFVTHSPRPTDCS